MFRVHLGDLERTGTLRVQRRIPGDDPLWEGAGLTFSEPVDVDLTLTKTASEQVVAQGEIRTVLRHACRRCLAELDVPTHVPTEIVWSPRDQLSEREVGEDGVRELDPVSPELDLGEAVREELLLAVTPYVLCREGCKGLCPLCGTDRNEVECDCVRAEPDPRWAALRALDGH